MRRLPPEPAGSAVRSPVYPTADGVVDTIAWEGYRIAAAPRPPLISLGNGRLFFVFGGKKDKKSGERDGTRTRNIHRDRVVL